jgi:hypothetical protein
MVPLRVVAIILIITAMDVVVAAVSAMVGVPAGALASVGLARLHLRESCVIGIEAIVDGGELAQDAIQLRIHGRRIGHGAGHGYRCTRNGLRYQIDTTWFVRSVQGRVEE